MQHFARRLQYIEPFHVMELLARAKQLEAEGRSVVHMEIGEPDFTTAEPVVAAGVEALRAGLTQYTAATGLPALREAIAGHYERRYAVRVDPGRIVVTPGGSGALLLALALIVDPGDEVLLPDPGYPCNRHFVSLLNGVPKPVPVDSRDHYQLTLEQVEAHWGDRGVAAMIGSPGNPTGTLIDAKSLDVLSEAVAARGGALVVDEIYHGLVYGNADAVTAADRGAFVVNSFSKYFGMTGWRLGWLVVPDGYQRAAEKVAQNVYISAPTVAQYAALACFTESATAIFEERRRAFEARRDYLCPALTELGFKVGLVPEGAFYLYADCSDLTDDTDRFARRLLDEAGVAITPGLDFGVYRARDHVRFAYTTSLERLREGVSRIGRFLA